MSFKYSAAISYPMFFDKILRSFMNQNRNQSDYALIFCISKILIKKINYQLHLYYKAQYYATVWFGLPKTTWRTNMKLHTIDHHSSVSVFKGFLTL